MPVSRHVRRILAAGTTAGLLSAALAFAPVLTRADATADIVTAAELGLAYAPKVVHVEAPTLEIRNAVIALGLDSTEHASNDHVELVLTSAAEEQLLRDAGYEFEVEIADLVLDESRRIAADLAFAERVGGVSAIPSGRTTYRVLGDFEADIDKLVTANPTLATKVVVGQSVEGLDIIGVEVGADIADEDGTVLPDDGRPVFLMFGVHHAREWPSAELPMEFAIDIVDAFTDEDHVDHDRISDLLSRARVIVVPVSNPDGYHVSRTTADLTFDFTNGPAWWRKNCRIVGGMSQPEGACLLLPLAAGQTSPIGVDLNRNYGGLWGGPGASTNPADGTYRGPAPFSEPETQAIRDLISTRQVTTLITNHTRGHLLLRPNGVAPSTISPDGFPRGYAPDECFTLADGSDYGMQALGERMTAQNGYSNQFGWELYDTTGTTEDYSYNATGGYGYTFELMPSGGSFHPAYEVVVGEYLGTNADSQNLKVLEGTAEAQEAAQALTTPGKDDCTGTPVQHDTLGGGLRESYLIALENAANAATHSLIIGTAPAGAVITVTREGRFPTWESEFIDVVTTSMTVGADGTFAYHVNPSTRPVLDSRRYEQDGEVLETGRRTIDGELFEGEYWTVSCSTGGTPVDVLVERGESVDVGDVCG